MKKYVVRYEERLARSFIIEAENENDAFDKFYNKTRDGDIQLDYEDYFEDYISVEREATSNDLEIYQKIQ